MIFKIFDFIVYTVGLIAIWLFCFIAVFGGKVNIKVENPMRYFKKKDK